MMAVPMMLLYEISIIGAMIFGKKKQLDSEQNLSEDPDLKGDTDQKSSE
jgi:Sec-independent protein secretion pathway component TatC